MEMPARRIIGKRVKDNHYVHIAALLELDADLREQINLAATSAGLTADMDFNVIKIDEASNQISLLFYENFFDNPFPALQRSCVVDVESGHIKLLRYDLLKNPPILHRKSRFITEDFPHYAEQAAFEKALDTLNLFNQDDSVSLPVQVCDDRLKAARVEIDGFTVKSSDTLPHLDERCGKHFLFRNFIECGETQAKTNLPNIPQQVETYNVLTRLATLILDPVIDYFGEIVLTYGFCSRELAKHISGRIAPPLDQHATCELNTRGQAICKRLGAAVDFIVTDESMLEVAQWIVQHTPFDRLYFYGNDRPVHVSCGPENKREVVVMTVSKTGRLVPRVVSAKEFFALSCGTAIDCT